MSDPVTAPSESLPFGWTMTKTGDVSSSIVPGRNKPNFTNDGIPWVTISDIDTVKVGKSKDNICVCRDDLKKAGGKTVPIASVIMSCVGEFGIVAIAENELIINQQLHAFVCNSNIEPLFLAYVLSTKSHEMLNLATQTTIAYLNKNNCESIQFLLPPLSEQQKIAAILTSVDEVIKKTQAQIDKLKDLKTGMMQELLTKGIGHTEFKDSSVGRIPAEWEVVTVGTLADVIDPQPDHRTPAEVENGIPYVGLGDIDKAGVINFNDARKVSQAAFDKQLKGFEIHEHAFVFGKIGTIGNPSILPDHRFYCLSANVVLITTPNLLNMRYLYQLFMSGVIDEQVAIQTNTTSQPALGIKKVRDFLVPVPIDDTEKQKLVDALSSVDKKTKLVKDKLALLNSQKNGLMQDLLTGKVRVNTEQANAEVAVG